MRWLYETLRPLLAHDHLFKALWECYTAVKEACNIQDVVCGIFKSDYMFDRDDAVKQLEMNTFSVAGVCHAQTMARMHHHIQVKVSEYITTFLDLAASPCNVIAWCQFGHHQSGNNNKNLPANNNMSSLINIFSEAHKLYKPLSQNPTCLLMITQLDNFNIADERPLEYGLWNNKNIPCYRCDWQDVLQNTHLSPHRTLLFHDPNLNSTATFEVPSSTTAPATKCTNTTPPENKPAHASTLPSDQMSRYPNASHHFQSHAASPHVSRRRERIPLPPSGCPKKQRNIHAHANPLLRLKGYTISPRPNYSEGLRPQPNLEGGGHNIYREAIPDFLTSLPKEEWGNYVLMRMIEPPKREGLLMTWEGLYEGSIVSELGILGTCFWKRSSEDENGGGGVEILVNEVAGWTFKSKPADVDEMSVVKGYGCFVCPRLT